MKSYITTSDLRHWFRYVTNGTPEIVYRDSNEIFVRDKTRYYRMSLNKCVLSIYAPHHFISKNYKYIVGECHFSLEEVYSLKTFKSFFRMAVEPYRVKQNHTQTKSTVDQEGDICDYCINGITSSWHKRNNEEPNKTIEGTIESLIDSEMLYRPYHLFAYSFLYRQFLPRHFRFEIDKDKFYSFEFDCVTVRLKDKYQKKYENVGYCLNQYMVLKYRQNKWIKLETARFKGKVTKKKQREFLKHGIRKLITNKRKLRFV